MKIKTLLVVLILFISNTLIGQSLNEYKYVIIPSKYDFQKTEDQYKLNSLTKFLFEKEGFTTFYDNIEMPTDVVNNPCAILTARVNNESNMFTTKMVFELINCKNKKVFIGEEGRSKEKDYKRGYQEALREAFKSVTAQNYNYKGNLLANNVNNSADDIKNVVEEVEEDEVMELEIKAENQIIEPSNMLYAQGNSLGYQLVDNTPKVVYTLLYSSKKEVFLLKGKSGMIYKQNNTWFVEYYNQNKLVKKPLNIKF